MMKKIVILLLAAVPALSGLCACSGEKKMEETTKAHVLGSYVSTLDDYNELRSGNKYVGRKMGWNCMVVNVTEAGDQVYLLTEITTSDGKLINKKVYGFVRLTKAQLRAMTKTTLTSGVILEAKGKYDGVAKVGNKSYPCIIGSNECKFIW